MVQHAGAYPILRNLQALPTGETEVLPTADVHGEINRKVRERIQLAQERNSRTYNTRARDVVFQPGQEVFRRNFQQSDAIQNLNAMLAKQWMPARKVRRKGANLYLPRTCNKGRLSRHGFKSRINFPGRCNKASTASPYLF